MAYTPKLTYKGRPLVRCGNDIYYGSMKDPFVVYLQVLSGFDCHSCAAIIHQCHIMIPRKRCFDHKVRLRWVDACDLTFDCSHIMSPPITTAD